MRTPWKPAPGPALLLSSVLVPVLAGLLAAGAARADSARPAPAGGKPAAAPAPAPAQAAPADTEPQDVFTGVARVVAIGDLHGDYDKFVAALRLGKLVDGQGHWIGGKTFLVQTGDVLDRGPDSKKIMDLLMQLEREAKKAGGRVLALIGNHEFMNIMGDWRYVSDPEFAAFGDGPRQTPVGREPVGDFPRYRAAFAPTGPYGAWILTHSAIVKVNGTLFMHGGLSPAYASRDIHQLNQSVRAELLGKRDARTGVGADPQGPLWYRGLAEPMQEPVLQAQLDQLFAAQKASRIVMGHTIQEKGVTLRANGRLALIDVGMSRFTIGGAASGLLIEAGGPTAPGTDRITVLRDGGSN